MFSFLFFLLLLRYLVPFVYFRAPCFVFRFCCCPLCFVLAHIILWDSVMFTLLYGIPLCLLYLLYLLDGSPLCLLYLLYGIPLCLLYLLHGIPLCLLYLLYLLDGIPFCLLYLFYFMGSRYAYFTLWDPVVLILRTLWDPVVLTVLTHCTYLTYFMG